MDNLILSEKKNTKKLSPWDSNTWQKNRKLAKSKVILKQLESNRAEILLDIANYPSLYSIKTKIGFDGKNFDVTAGTLIKEIAHTVSVNLSCSNAVNKYAMIVKMFKVFCMSCQCKKRPRKSKKCHKYWL